MWERRRGGEEREGRGRGEGREREGREEHDTLGFGRRRRTCQCSWPMERGREERVWVQGCREGE